MNNDNSGTMFAGGAIVVVVLIGLCLKALQGIFNQLGRTFDAFGNMAYSFFTMAWEVILALALVAAGLACIYAAVYFTFKYYRMVKRGTEIQEAVDIKVHELMSQVESRLVAQRAESESRLRDVRSMIKEVREKQVLMLAAPKPVLVAAVETSGAVPVAAAELETASPVDVSNPF